MDEVSFPQRYERFLADCTSLILERAGDERIRCLFVCGSFAAGEGSVLFVEGRPVFLSDLDLVLVVDTPRSHQRLFPRRRLLAEACEELFPQARFAGRVDLGVMLAGELASLQPSPGVYDMRHRGRVMYGDPGVLEMLPAIDASAIGSDAARLLCENRIAALLAAGLNVSREGDGCPPEFLYALARVYTDIATALMCGAGEYRPGYARRRHFIADDPAGSRLREMLGKRLMKLIDEWSAFKLRPEPVPEPASGRRPGELWIEAGRDMMWAWRRMVALSAGRDPERCGSPEQGELPAPRQTLRMIDALRLWKTWILGFQPAARPGALMTALACARSGGPQDVVRREAVRLLDAALAGGVRGRVPGAHGGFPHRGGDWSAAAHATSAAWKRLVYGGEV